MTAPDANALFQQALDAHRRNRHGDAMVLYQRVLELDMTHAPAHNNLAMIHQLMDKHQDALRHFEQAYKLKPANTDFMRGYGIGLMLVGDTPRAEQQFEAVLKANPKDLLALDHLAQIYLNTTRLPQLLARLESFAPDKWPQVEFLYYYCMALIGLQRYDDALSIVRKVQSKHAKDVGYLRVLGAILLQMSHYDEAVTVMRKTTELEPDAIGNWTNLCAACKGAYLFDEGITAGEKALAIDPDHYDALANLGVLYRERGDAEKSMLYLTRALELRPVYPNAHYNYGLSLVAAGYLREGWAETEWRWQTDMNRHMKRPDTKPQWDGSDIGEAVLCIFSDQGVGDTVQMCRFLPLIHARAPKATLIVRAEEKLLPLLRAHYGELAQFVPIGSMPPFDYHHPLFGLLATLGIDADQISGKAYLRSDTPKQYRDHPGQKIIGLSWHTKSVNTGFKRSLKLEEFAFLNALGGDIKIIDLQYGDTSAERAQNAENGFALHHDESVDAWVDLQPFVDQVAGCDLVISIDNTTVHVAGALGIPVWTLIPFIPYWRWTLNKEQTLWYDSMRFFQQTQPGQYDDVLARIKTEISSWISGDSSVLTPVAPYEPLVPPYAQRQTEKLAVILNAPSDLEPIGERLSRQGLVEEIKGRGYAVESISGAEVERMPILPPTLQQFDDALYASRWRMLNPSLVDKIARADKVVLNGGASLTSLSQLPLKLLYLLYFAHRFEGKPVSILNHACFPEGGLALTDAQIVAYYRKVYTLCEDVAVTDPFSQHILTQLQIPVRLAAPALPLFNAPKPEKAASVAVLIEGWTMLQLSEFLGQIAGLLQPQALGLTLLYGARDRVAAATARQCSALVKAVTVTLTPVETYQELADAIAGSAALMTNQLGSIALALKLSQKILVIPGTHPDVEGYCQKINLPLASLDNISNIKGLPVHEMKKDSASDSPLKNSF